MSGLSVILAFSDAILLYSAGYSYHRLFYYRGFILDLSPWSLAAWITLGGFIGMTSFDMYNRRLFLDIYTTLSCIFFVIPLVLILTISSLVVRDYVLQGTLMPGSYAVCIAAILTFFVIVGPMRKFGLAALDHSGKLTRRILFIGANSQAINLWNLSKDFHFRSFQIVGHALLKARNDSTAVWAAEELNRTPLVCPTLQGNDWQIDTTTQNLIIEPTDLRKFCREHSIDEIIIGCPAYHKPPLTEALKYENSKLVINDICTFLERESGRIIFDDNCLHCRLKANRFTVGKSRLIIQRIFDISVASFVLILSLPIMLITAILIKLEGDGPLFYRQERVGLDGKTFNIVKFRSMRVDAEKSGPRWAAKNDNRVTCVGSFIRKVRIDELPQLINVLKGEMALVGPRPERPVFVVELEQKIAFYDLRHIAKPGITGWAQINYPYGGTVEDSRKKLAFDLYYIGNGSIFLDTIIIIQTIKTVLRRDGAR